MSEVKRRKFYLTLGEIAADIDGATLKQMKFICKGVKIPPRVLEEIQEASGLFNALEDIDKLNENNLTYLKELLAGIQKVKLIQKLDNFEREHGMAPGQPTTPSVGTPGIQGIQLPPGFVIASAQSIIPQPQQIHAGTQEQGEDLSKEFQVVVDHIGRNWRQLARRMALSEADIDHISHNHVRNLREQGMQCLLLWKMRKGPDATKQLLIKKLRECEFNYIADTLHNGRYH